MPIQFNRRSGFFNLNYFTTRPENTDRPQLQTVRNFCRPTNSRPFPNLQTTHKLWTCTKKNNSSSCCKYPCGIPTNTPFSNLPSNNIYNTHYHNIFFNPFFLAQRFPFNTIVNKEIICVYKFRKLFRTVRNLIEHSGSVCTHPH